MDTGDVMKAVQLIREQIVHNKRPSRDQTRGLESIPDTIKKLSDLRDAGILSEEEFSMKKAELLKRL